MKDRLVETGSYLLAGLVSCITLSAVTAAMEHEPPLPVTVASQEAENVHAAAEATASMPQEGERRFP